MQCLTKHLKSPSCDMMAYGVYARTYDLMKEIIN